MRERRHATEIVADEYAGGTVSRRLGENVDQDLLAGVVEPGEGLVEEEEPRSVEQRAREREALERAA